MFTFGAWFTARSVPRTGPLATVELPPGCALLLALDVVVVVERDFDVLPQATIPTDPSDRSAAEDAASTARRLKSGIVHRM